ncbi:phospholipase D-like domain-containing protein [Dapis sp. BLCC M126]|uniref:phospholipase D-like domain-containing protein n=1 Tax=Dapis sp. BLCC M126 TaxID=3400189 RepID=UPI003CE9413A
MFLQSPTKYIDSQLNNLADKIEKDSPGLSVFAARQFCYQLYQTPIQIEITKERDLNILEEFILRASIEFNPPPTEVELAQILKLDPIFIQNTTNTLQSLQTLTLTPPDFRITITSEGKEFYTKGSLPQPPENKLIYAITNPLSEEINWRLSAITSKSPEVPNLADFITFENTIPDIASLTIEELRKQILDSDLGIHIPESGQIVKNFSVNKDAEKITWKALSILVIFDVIEEKLILQAREGNKILESVSNQLQEMAEKGEIFLNELCGLPPESIASETESILELKNQKVEERLQKIRQKGIEIIKTTREKGRKTLPKNSEFILLRDRQIRPEFLSTLKSANQQILIYSPWVTEEVVDEEFLQILQKLANNGVWILIGYGIAEKQEEETKLISPKVEEKLLTIRTPEDLPAAQIFWLGNSHAKEVLVDRKIHLSGSHNWLSYRGDRNFRGETTYKVTNADTINSSYEYLQARFQSHADNLWKSAVSNHNINLAIKSVCIWGTLGMKEMALQELQYHNWIELFPVWLKVVIHGLRSTQISPDEPIFEKAISWLKIVDKSDKNIEDLQSGWQRVIEAIAHQNRQAALNLLNDTAWGEFIRLEISLTDTPEKFISKLL